MPTLECSIADRTVEAKDLRRRDLLLAGLATAGLAGCGTPPPPPSTSGRGSIEHQFGKTPIPGSTDRVVCLGFVDHDAVLALGVVPVALSRWYSSMERGVGPWAEQALGSARPHLFTTWTDIPPEQVAALSPDAIVAIYFELTKGSYTNYANIAPTLAQPAGFRQYGVPWRYQTRLTGRLLGRSERAEKLIRRVDERIAAARREHPEFAGKTINYVRAQSDGNYYAYTKQDLRIRLLEELGFRLAPAIDSAESANFTATISPERAAMLDADVLVINDREALAAPTIRALDVVKRNAAIPLETDLEMAVSASTVLSIPYALDRLVEQLASAI